MSLRNLQKTTQIWRNRNSFRWGRESSALYRSLQKDSRWLKNFKRLCHAVLETEKRHEWQICWQNENTPYISERVANHLNGELKNAETLKFWRKMWKIIFWSYMRRLSKKKKHSLLVIVDRAGKHITSNRITTRSRRIFLTVFFFDE